MITRQTTINEFMSRVVRKWIKEEGVGYIVQELNHAITFVSRDVNGQIRNFRLDYDGSLFDLYVDHGSGVLQPFDQWTVSEFMDQL